MSTVIIAKNQTAGDLSLANLSAPNPKIPASGQVTLTDYNDVWEIQEDPELLAYITNDEVLLKLNGIDLNKADSLNAMSPPAASKDADALYRIQSEPTGFPNRTDSTISRSDSGPDRTFTVAPAGPPASFDFYIVGTKFTKSSAQTKVWPDTEGFHFFYFDAAGDLQTTTTFSRALVTGYAWVATLYWDATNKVSIYFGDERHGLVMDGETHIYLHTTLGARWVSGLGLSNIIADGGGSLDTHVRFSVDDGVVRDEDIELVIQDDSPQDLAPIAQVPILYRTGASGVWRKKTADNFPVIYQGTAGYGGGLRLPFNEFTGGSWGFTELADKSFVGVHFFGTNDVDEPFVGIQGQVEYTKISDARDGIVAELRSLSLAGLPVPEMAPIASILLETRSAYSNTPKAQIRTTGDGEDYIDFRKANLLAGASTTAGAGMARFFIPASDLNTNLGNHRVRSISGTGNHRFIFVIPTDFVSLISLSLVGISTVTTSADIDVSSDYGKDGENYNHHSEARDGGTTPTALTADQVERFDLSDVFSAIEAGDACGFNWDHNSIGGTMYFWGVELRYYR